MLSPRKEKIDQSYIRRAIDSTHQFFGDVTLQPNHQFQITNFFFVPSHQNVLYNIVVIASANLKCLSQLNYIAHFGGLKQKNWQFEIADLFGDFTKQLMSRMDGIPKYLHHYKLIIALDSL